MYNKIAGVGITDDFPGQLVSMKLRVANKLEKVKILVVAFTYRPGSVPSHLDAVNMWMQDPALWGWLVSNSWG